MTDTQEHFEEFESKLTEITQKNTAALLELIDSNRAALINFNAALKDKLEEVWEEAYQEGEAGLYGEDEIDKLNISYAISVLEDMRDTCQDPEDKIRELTLLLLSMTNPIGN